MVDEYPRHDAHSHELLEEQLARVGDVHLAELGLIAAVAALARLFGEIGCRDHATLITDVDTVGIRVSIQTVTEEISGSVGDKAVAFHLPHTQASLTSTALSGLASKHSHWATRSSMHLVIYKMFEALVEGRSEKDERLEGSPSVSIVHALVAVLLIHTLLQCAANILYREVIHKRGRITLFTQETADFAKKTLYEMPHGHAGGDGVGVDDDVRGDALTGERHILLRKVLNVIVISRKVYKTVVLLGYLAIGHSYGSLLPMTRSKLIPDLRDAQVADANLTVLVAILICREHNSVDIALFIATHT